MALRDPFRSWLRGWCRSLLFIPVCTIVLILLLAALRLNGSSIGLVAADTDHSPQAAFELRSLRSDEWHLRTPMVVRQAMTDFPKTSDIGMGVHDVGPVLDFPVRSYAAIVKPSAWPYFLVSVERAFAFEWWLTVLGPFLGVYAVLAAITRTRLVPALSGLLASAAPVMVWWTVPWLGLSVLYAGVMAAMVIIGGQSRRQRRYAYFALGGWAAACCAAELYLPWVIPLGLLFGAIAVSQLTRAFKTWKEFLYAASCCLGVFVVLVAIFYRAHHVALGAISDSVYPGRRSTEGGGGSPVLMFGAPFDSQTFRGGTTVVAGTNQSEAASGLMLWFPIAMVGGGFSGIRSRSGAAKALAVTLFMSLVFVAWAILPLPSWLGGLIGLTRVQGSRLVVPLTVGSALAAGLYAHRIRTDGAFRPSRDRIALGLASFVAITGWAALQISINGAFMSPARIILIVTLFGIATWLLLDGRAVIGLSVACVLLLFSTARVNPIQIGLGPLIHNPLLAQVKTIASQDPSARWASINGGVIDYAALTASGVPMANGVDLYAVPERWHLLDPTDADEPQWNRFANLEIFVDDTLTTAQIVSPQGDLLIVSTPSCDGALQQLDVTYVVADTELSSPCLRADASPTAAGQRWVYVVISP